MLMIKISRLPQVHLQYNLRRVQAGNPMQLKMRRVKYPLNAILQLTAFKTINYVRFKSFSGMARPLCLVPIATDILLIGQNDYISKTKWSSVKDNYYNLYQHQLPDQPAPFGEKDCPEPGVHIMWTLPYSMRRGAQDKEKNEIAFPKVP